MASIGLAPHFLLFVSGGLALVYELLWMRRFAVVFGAATPAVSATLAAIFLGFAVGSTVLGARAARLAVHLQEAASSLPLEIQKALLGTNAPPP